MGSIPFGCDAEDSIATDLTPRQGAAVVRGGSQTKSNRSQHICFRPAWHKQSKDFNKIAVYRKTAGPGWQLLLLVW